MNTFFQTLGKTFEVQISVTKLHASKAFLEKHALSFLFVGLSTLSITSFVLFYRNGLGLSYNDAQSHLDIGRRVVEGLKPGLAQLGSVWLPLNHLLMVPTIWNDFMWHSGLAGALQSMIAYVVTAILVYQFLKELEVGLLGRFIGVFVFALNLNILYMQSTAMTELLLLVMLTAGAYALMRWHKTDKLLYLIHAAFFIMLASLIRYEGWFLFGWAGILIIWHAWRKHSYQTAEGTFILYATLAGLGIFLWFVWNQLIFKDALYFVLGPFSAHTQQKQLAQAGVLSTKGNLGLSIKIYMYALIYNSGAFTVILGTVGAVCLWFDTKIKSSVRIATSTLLAPLIFNVLALFAGFSVLFIQGISGNTWFNVRYGLMVLPSLAIFTGYLVDRLKPLRLTLVGLLLMVTFFSLVNADAVTLDDARVGSSQKNVTEVSSYLNQHAKNVPGFILISAASHDAIIFSSGLPMKKFIHEGTGAYWESATTSPDRWARWIVMRTYDDNDLTYKAVSRVPGFSKYTLVAKYPFADVYEINEEFVSQLNTEPILGKQK